MNSHHPYEERATSEDSEKITASWIDQALTVWDRMIKVPSVAALMLKMDHDYGHDAPLNGIVAMQGLVSKTRTEDWTLECPSLQCLRSCCPSSLRMAAGDAAVGGRMH